MMKRIIVIAITIIFLILAIIIVNCKNTHNQERTISITVTANTSDAAAIALSERLFEGGSFDDVSISEFQMSDYIQISEYKDMTMNGRVFSYELIYKFKTDDARAFMDNKITSELVETNVWLDDVIARRCIVMFEHNNVYYNLFNWDEISFDKNFVYNNSEYDGSNSSPKDWLECNIIKAVFDNCYNIAEMNMSETPPTESVKNKLLRDVEMVVNPEYQIDKNATGVYDLAFDDEIKCIYFSADIYDTGGRKVVDGKRFAMFLNGGFSIYDIENIVPKYAE